MPECIVEVRDRVRAVKARLVADPRVEAVDWLPPEDGQHDGWTLEVTCVRDCERIPAEILTTLGGHGFGAEDVGRQGPFPHAVAVLQR